MMMILMIIIMIILKDDEDDEGDFNLAAMKCDSDDEDNGYNGSNDMKRHLWKIMITT